MDTQVLSDIESKVEKFFKPYAAHHVSAGEILIQAGEEPEGIFYLEEGQVRVYDIAPKGSEVVVNVFKPHAFFPMNWAITALPNRYFFEATVGCSLRLAPAPDVIAFIRSNPDVLFDLLRRVYTGIVGVERRMAHLMGGTARSRLIFELMVECQRFGNRQTDKTYILSIHEEELARRSGMSRETVNRELSKLKQEGFVAMQRHNLIVRDLYGLQQLLGESL
jgi:CRP-like cAMP-binding protein